MFLNSPLSFVNPMFTNISLKKDSRDCRHYKVLEENEKEIIILTD